MLGQIINSILSQQRLGNKSMIKHVKLHRKICLLLMKSQSSLSQDHSLPSFYLHMYNHLQDCVVNYVTDVTKLKITLRNQCLGKRIPSQRSLKYLSDLAAKVNAGNVV